ncbi:MAG: potassium transporter [Gammaproteobacteria bacterium CG11_big_fil_rev_8_21_14_0_20_46_22]|nr:MAG: potassium transporter [Gammaproteobacteria bacterium CG12_big_fil_rev_8_21_14_0_65_46_12]PIR12052.1 MAG: potassium transporter [Gammaproteobacteria bacterium CG11_big_fil_rev_8_21_14_0_20_46_22]
MQFRSVFRVLGLLLIFFSITMLVPIPVGYYFNQPEVWPFLLAFSITFLTGLLLWVPTRGDRAELKIRDGFFIVILFWTVLSFFSCLPIWLGIHFEVNFTDAIFESVSGFTTTGATAIANLDQVPAALLYYRQQLQFLGGMGIIVLAVAILPMLGVGGMQLYRAETPGPMKEDKITPRITETAKAIWVFYVGLVILCSLAYWAAGMPIFDAVEESFGTISTGGFSIHNASFAYYHSNLIDVVCIIFMLLGGTNFSLHYLSVTRGSIRVYLRDVEFRYYIAIAALVSFIGLVVLSIYHVYPGIWNSLVKSTFAVVSVMTTTGFVDGAFATWPLFIPVLIILLGLLGSCGGSTSGGMKMLRFVLLKKQLGRELKRLIHPQGVYAVKINNRVVPEHVVEAVWAFVTAYIALLLIGVLLIMATGLDFTTAFGSMASALGNVGAAIGQYAYNMADLNSFSKWVLIVGMLAGRLEIFTLLVIFSRSFWQR